MKAAALLALGLSVRGQAAANVSDYVALGDSYSSGTGLQAYRDTTTCYRSNLAWPVQLSNSIAAKQGKAVKFTFPACSGAKTADVRANQLSQVTSKADLVTMTIGGNDLGFSTVVQTCLTQQYPACEAIIAEKEALLPQLQSTLTALYKDIRKRMKATGRLLIANYPNLISNPYPGVGEQDLCTPATPNNPPVCVGFDSREVARLKLAAQRLADTTAQAIAATGDKRVQLIDVRPTFNNPEPGKGCQGTPEWIRCLYVLDVSALLISPQDFSDGSFHPNEQGHTAYGDVAFATFQKPL